MGKEKIRNRQGVMTATYRPGKYELVNMEEVKILVNGSVKGLAPVAVYEKRRRHILEVRQAYWTPITAYQGEYLTDNVIMTFLKKTLQIAFECERQGLRIDNLCWDFNKVFVDQQGDIRMIYWPVTTLTMNTTAALEFYRQFCTLLASCPGMDREITQRYTAYFYQRAYLDFPLFQQLLMELIERWTELHRRRKKKDNPDNKPDEQKRYYGWLERVDTAEHYDLDADCIGIGRDKSKCRIYIRGHITVGRLHAQILFENGQYYLVDMGSRNGTTVDDVIVAKDQRWPLADGARIRFAEVEFLFREPEDKGTTLIHQQKRGRL